MAINKNRTSKDLEFRAGYKHTTLGWIPGNWKLMEFSEFASKSSVKYDPQNNKDAKKCIELEHLSQCTGELLGYTDSRQHASIKNVFQAGEVLFGKLRPYLRKYWLATFDGVCSSEIWVLTSNISVYCNEFLFYFIQGHHFIQATNVTSGSKMPRADWNYISAIPFPIPPLPEQKAIAALLSTWDKAISNCQLLIENYQLRKKWLMQQLLTGKKRLPGFSDEWKTVDLLSCFEFIKSYSIPRDGLVNSTTGGSIYCIHYGDIHAFFENDFLDFSKQENIPLIKEDAIITDAGNYLKEGDVIIADASEDYNGVGEAVTVLNIDKYIAVGGLHTIVLRSINDAIDKYFRGYLFASETIRNELRRKATGTSVYSVSKSSLQTLSFKLPSCEEQAAIACILQIADEEITLQKQKLETLKDQKKGLMQVLLTGKKRLIADKENAQGANNK